MQFEVDPNVILFIYIYILGRQHLQTEQVTIIL